MSNHKKIAIVACAGMDKGLGSVARTSVFKVVEELRSDRVELISLVPLLSDVAPHTALVTSMPIVIVDGCIERCATKLIIKKGGRIKGRVLVSNSARKYGVTPKSASDIGQDGEKLSNAIADEAASLVDKLIGEKKDE
ncbi:MAG: putative zinc-binding protein [Candidatus Bathyarchaeota archaeon]|nr:putative zinc-binding protein [Candidatus Bathyarchaeota archaeon]